MDPQSGQGAPFPDDPDWQRKQIERVVARYPQRFREDLKAELAITVLKLKHRWPAGILNGKAYVATALQNRASSLAKKSRTKEGRELSPPIDPETIAPSLPSEEIAWRRRQARRQLAEVRRLLEAESYAFMEALADADNNQSLLAQRSGIHRNTVGRRWARIKRQLIRCPIENVTAHERHQLAEMATAPEIRARDRFKARLILALVAGASYGEIAKEFQTSRPTISRWKRRFQKGGMAGLKARHRGKKPDVVSRRLVANWLRRQRRQGMAPGCPSSRSIARTLGISKSTVHRILRAHRRQKS